MPRPAEHLLQHAARKPTPNTVSRPPSAGRSGSDEQQVGRDRRRRAHGQRAREPLDAGDQHPRRGPGRAAARAPRPAGRGPRASSGSVDQQGDGRRGERRRPAGGAPGPAARTARASGAHGSIVADAQRPIRSTSGAVAPLSACPKPGTTQAVAVGPAAWARARKCSSGKYSSRSPCTSSSGVGAMRADHLQRRGRRDQPRLGQPQPAAAARAEPPAGGRLQQPVHPLHRPGVADVPAADRAAGSRTASGRCAAAAPPAGAPHRRPWTSPNGDDRVGAVRARRPDRGVEVAHLGVAARRSSRHRSRRDPGSPGPDVAEPATASRPAGGTTGGPRSW